MIIMKNNNHETVVTRNLLQFCYTCEDAHLCTTEDACMECWTRQGLLDNQADNVNETQQLLQFYYA